MANKKPSHPAFTPEQYENRCIELAFERTEKMLADPNSKPSSQLLTYLMKRGTIEREIELEKLKRENDLLAAKKEAYDSAVRTEELYAGAIEAMKSYCYGDGND